MARLRTRYDLLDLLRITELAVKDEIGRWESVVAGNDFGALEYFDRWTAVGARQAYEWALGIQPDPVMTSLLPEEVDEARMAYEAEQRRLRREAEQAHQPY